MIMVLAPQNAANKNIQVKGFINWLLFKVTLVVSLIILNNNLTLERLP
jgi:hypothetical protein